MLNVTHKDLMWWHSYSIVTCSSPSESLGGIQLILGRKSFGKDLDNDILFRGQALRQTSETECMN